MMTIDDSGSMLSDAMPEGTFTVNGKSVGLITNFWVGAFPTDQRKGGVNAYQNCSVTAVKGANEPVYQMQFRSPQINSIWYDTNTRYQPWISSDGVSRMNSYQASSSPWDPVIGTNQVNLTITYFGINTEWCDAANNRFNGARDFYPGLYYVLTAGADPTLTASYTRYDINVDGEHAPTTKPAGRTDCVASTTRCTQAEERQNFANWFTFYRMRESLTKAAVSDTFAKFVGKIRAGWGQINPGNAKLDSSNVVQQSIRALDSSSVQSLITNVQNISSWPSTPLRTAMDSVGQYFQKTDVNNPWKGVPGSASDSSSPLTCRRSVNVLMTDGYYNDTYTAAGDVDGVNGPDYSAAADNPNGYSPTRYVAARPYIDGATNRQNTLADVAMRYYVNDLQTGIANKVPPVDGDIAYWQHLTQFTVGLGVKGTLDSSSTSAKLSTLKAIKDGTANWPDPTAGNPQKIDDMWHAAVNTGGDFYSVRNVTELADALDDAFGRAAGASSKEAGVALSGAVLAAGTLKLVPKYKSASWNGDLEAYTLLADGTLASTVPAWTASTMVPAAASRNLYTWDSSGPKLFTWSGMNGFAAQSLVGSAALTNYIRGDATDEGVGAAYRSRGSNKLGDFVNSPPVFVKDLVDLGYDVIRSDYRAYVNLKKARSTGVVFLGGNAGILHGFDSSTGAEVYGYLPKAGLVNLKTIAAKDYGTPTNYHRFFVDGTVTESDAYIQARGASAAEWTNVVVGSMGAGGKAFFALHVPTSAPTSLGVNALMWERNSDDGAGDDIGHIYGEIGVGKVKGGGWKAFVGNGVYSKNGNAALLVVDLATGTIDKTITVSSSGSNGLMGVRLLTDPTTKEVIAAYAGDLQGNLWRFDFEGASASDWKIGFNGQPLFVAAIGSTRQPITAAPVYIDHASGTGRVVLFGTGRLIDSTDADANTQQTFYGVWDKTLNGASSATTTSPFASYTDDRTALQAQLASATAQLINGTNYYSVNSTPVDWATQLGWYMDMPFGPSRNPPGVGQRVMYPPLLLASDYVLIQTMVPAGAAADCDSSFGSGYNYILEARNGTQLATAIFDTDGDGDVDSNDTAAAGYATGADGVDKALYDATDPNKLVLENTTGARKVQFPTNQYVVKDRIWRQIVNPPAP